jgi:hypothetical protein
MDLSAAGADDPRHRFQLDRPANHFDPLFGPAEKREQMGVLVVRVRAVSIDLQGAKILRFGSSPIGPEI